MKFGMEAFWKEKKKVRMIELQKLESLEGSIAKIKTYGENLKVWKGLLRCTI